MKGYGYLLYLQSLPTSVAVVNNNPVPIVPVTTFEPPKDNQSGAVTPAVTTGSSASSSQGSGNTTSQLQGQAGQAGGVSTSNNLPNIYFNFKNFSYNNLSLKFKFSTDSLNSGSSATDTWQCDPSIKAGNANLVGPAGCLTPAYAYGKYFYELAYNTSITNSTFLLTPSFSPSYAVLVFAIANTNTSGSMYQDFANLTKTSNIHKFIAADSTNASNDVFNFNSFKKTISENSTISQQDIVKAIFTGGTLNSSQFISSLPANSFDRYGNKINILSINPDRTFVESYTSGRTTITNAQLNLYDLFPFNSYNLPTDLNNPNDPVDFQITQGGSTVSYKNFSLFFVEMRCYMSPTYPNVHSRQAIFETYVNGILTSSAFINVPKTLDGSTLKNYIISLSNKTMAGVTNPNNKLFLFDYLYATTYNKNEMELQCRNTITSLVSKYRNLLIKSTSDLQIANSSKSLAFPVKFSHPFLNLFLSSKTV